jgi:hypothetical protein
MAAFNTLLTYTRWRCQAIVDGVIISFLELELWILEYFYHTLGCV